MFLDAFGDTLLIPFTKMHGLGNDYVYLDAIGTPTIAEIADLPALARAMSDRHTGIGSDGLIVIGHPTADSGIASEAGVGMQMFNADGSEGEMCGNGIRCVCKYAVDHGLFDVSVNKEGGEALRVETGAGVLDLTYALDDATGKVVSVTVDMGEPRLELAEVGVDADQVGTGDELQDAIFVGMGNPHAVLWVESAEELEALDLATRGARIESHAAFVNRINAHYVHVLARDEMRMRTFERGSGITRACGTGAAAVCVAGVLGRRVERRVLIHLPGGDLELEWRKDDGHVYMTGPAVEVFSGAWDAG